MPRETVIGTNLQTNNPVAIGDIERRSGLYALGRPGFGKSTLLCNILLQDYKKGYSAFFLDPHGDAIDNILARLPSVAKKTVYLLNPIDDDYKFGINPLYCQDVTKAADRRGAYNKTLAIFKRLWEQDNQWGVWLQLILENSLPVLIETGYTLTDMPLFLNNRGFREFLLRQVKYSGETLDFWQYEFKQEQAQPAHVRVRSLLGDADVRLIIGQQKTTINFSEFTGIPGKYLFLKIPQNMAEDAKRFIGTIITTELLHAIRNRSEEAKQQNYSLFIDEFQHFVADLDTFILETRKYACAISLAHQERLGQFGENQKILGATLACANKVLFQTTVKDARELAPEFVEKPTFTETRKIPELVISKEPVWNLVRTGHPNARVQELAYGLFEPLYRSIRDMKEEMEEQHLIRAGILDQAALLRDEASIYGIEERHEAVWRGIELGQVRGRDIPMWLIRVHYSGWKVQFSGKWSSINLPQKSLRH